MTVVKWSACHCRTLSPKPNILRQVGSLPEWSLLSDSILSVGSSLVRRFMTSLLWDRINYGRKKFCDTVNQISGIKNFCN